jgi:hypothetical protein
MLDTKSQQSQSDTVTIPELLDTAPAACYNLDMSVHSTDKTESAKSYVIGQRSFAAISAVEGLKLASASEVRLERTRSLSPEQRRAETIRAFAGPRNRE